MTTFVEQEACNIILPLLNIAAAAGPPAVPAQITQGCIATSIVSARTDISALSAAARGHFFNLYADGADGEDIYVAFNTADAGAIDEAATGFGVTVCQCIKAGSYISGRLPGVDSGAAYSWLLHKAKSGTPKLRISITSIGPNDDARSLKA